MKKNQFTFSFIEKEVRNKTFGILTTINKDGSPHMTGVLYGVSPKSSEFALYITTSSKYKKTKNIVINPKVSFIIPFPHHFLRFVPSSTVAFNGEAEIVSFENDEILNVFSQKRILNMVTANLNSEEKKDYVFIKIKPYPKVLCYGIGHSIWKLRGSHTEGGYSVIIPQDRL